MSTLSSAPYRCSGIVALAVAGALTIAGCGGDDSAETRSGTETAADDAQNTDEGATDGANEAGDSSEAANAGADDAGDDGADDAGDDGGESDDSESGTLDLGDFPIPAPSGGDENTSVRSDISRLVAYPASRREGLIAFYERWLAEGDWVELEGITPTVAIVGDQFSAAAAVSETRFYQITGTPSGDTIEVALVVVG